MSDAALPAPPLRDLAPCFEGAVPAVIATASADGTPNITHLSKVHFVDDDHVGLSDQFFSKTNRNLCENPYACVLVIDPHHYDEYRLVLRYERSERRGKLFDRIERDIEAIAALCGMQGVFKLRGVDIYRVLEIERVEHAEYAEGRVTTRGPAPRLAELSARLSRCPDLDTLVGAALDGLAELFGYEYSLLLLLDEDGARLYTIASHGYAVAGIGSEVRVGEGVIGMAAARVEPMRLGNLGSMLAYTRTQRRAHEQRGGEAPGTEIPLPGLANAESQVAVPAMVLGQLVGVVAIESERRVAFDDDDEAQLAVVAGLVASAVEIDRNLEASGPDRVTATAAAIAPTTPAPSPAPSGPRTLVRFFPVDGSTFLDGDYLIKGVAGRILWKVLGQHVREQRNEFTNKEMRLDPALELPDFRDNFESRLVLLKRRLDERAAPIRIEKTGRGRFRVIVEGGLELEAVTPG